MAKIQLKPSPKQHLAFQLLFNKFTKFLLFGGGAGGGKSWLGCEFLLIMCYTFPGTRWFIGRKELKRIMQSTYITWMKVCKFHGIPQTDWKLNSQYHYIEFVNGAAKGSRIDLLDLDYMPSDPEFQRFGSLEYTGGWIEEGGEVHYMAFDVLKTRIGRYMNIDYDLSPKLLVTCNPTQNWIYRVFYKPWKKNELRDGYAFVQSLYNDNPFTAQYYASMLDEIDDPVTKARLKEGLWEYSADDLNVMNYDAIVDLFVNTVEDGVGYFTGDIARFGSDRIVLGGWRGFNLYKLIEKTRQSTVTTEADIKDVLRTEAIPLRRAIVDEDGVGGGVVDNIPGIHGFMGNRSPIIKESEELDEMDAKYKNLPNYKKPNYRNLRSQCYFMLGEKVNKREMAITAPLTDKQQESIIEELQQVKRVDTGAADAPLQIVSKDLMKEALGRSPDYADTMMMRMYFELLVPEKPKGKYNPPDEEKIIAMGGKGRFGGVSPDRPVIGWNR